MKSDYIKKIKLPDKPGVYFFKRGRDLLYIGKATSLKDRVKSYFGKDLIETRGPVLLDMLFKANKISWQKTDSVLEALILEAELIKKHQPKYNTKEKSDKSFNYVLITRDKIPKVLIIRGKDLGNHKGFSFGPYTNGSQLKTALQIIRKIFPFVDEASSKKASIEFYKQIHLTPTSLDEYIHNIKNLKLFLHGKKKDVLRNLKKEMMQNAKEHKFERAGEIKRQIFALQHINDVALLKQDSFVSSNFSSLRTAKRNSSLGKIEENFARIEAYDIAHMSGRNMVGVMTVIEDGEMVKSEYKKFRIRTQDGTNDTGALREVLERRLAHREWAYPQLIVVDGGVAQLNVAKKLLKKMNVKIGVVSVVKDDRHKAKVILSSRGETFLRSSEKIPRPFEKLPCAAILLANSEAHRFAIAYHKNIRGKNFLR